MLKSTHRPTQKLLPLPPGWTEHKAPTGHSYYFNFATKESTYARPPVESPQTVPVTTALTAPSVNVLGLGLQNGLPEFHSAAHRFDGSLSYKGLESGRRDFGSRFGHQHRQGEPVDRPKSKRGIPGCEPWLLITTKLRRRFVHNPETGHSFWRFPSDVVKHVVELDRADREKKEQHERDGGDEVDETQNNNNEGQQSTTPSVKPIPQEQTVKDTGPQDDSDEYEEVEVTDEEYDEGLSKRRRTEATHDNEHVEFNEDDIAYQLTAMGQDYGLDPGEYGVDHEDLEEGAEGHPLTEEDSNALFRDMLDDFHISPYTPWERVIEEGRIIEDDRYTYLSTMKTRKEAWSSWSRDRMQQLKEQRERQKKKDPRIPYFAFLQTHATPKLYWPEFRRKFRKEQEMRDAKVSDKDRERWYRDYINRLKLPDSTLTTDLVGLLKSIPLQSLNRSSSMEMLPAALLTDMRYVSLRANVRDPLIKAYIETIPSAPEQSSVSPEEEAELAKQKTERDRREKALAERAKMVMEEKRRQRNTLQYSRGILQEGEAEVQRAMQVGKEGLLSHMEAGEGGAVDSGLED